MLTLYSNAKINLGLHILGKREDGYHLLETVMYPVSLADTMHFSVLEKDGIQVEMLEFDEQIPPEKNLCVKAYQLLKASFPKLGGISIRIEKKIPAGAGLGGGSSNAAHTLLALNDLFDLKLTKENLATLAEPLGADVPFFIFNRPLLAKGIGNEFEEIDLDFPFEIRLHLPKIHSSTLEAYKDLLPTDFVEGVSLKKVLSRPVERWPVQLKNSLEGPAFRKYPELKQMKEGFYNEGAVYAAMSGSGSAVYGLFSKGE